MRGNAVCTVFRDGTRYFCIKDSGSFTADEVRRSPLPLPDGNPDPERSAVNSRKRAVRSIFMLARNNVWDWFITLTIDPCFCDRHDYAACSRLLRHFTRALQYRGCTWLIVPDQHKDGSYHFHGIIHGNLPVVDSTLTDPDGHTIYNVPLWKFGFTTATHILNQKRVSSYLTKYMVKDQIELPPSRRRYWASVGLDRPESFLCDVSLADRVVFAAVASFSKHIRNAYGEFDFFEV